jgi:cell division protein FtsQ
MTRKFGARGPMATPLNSRATAKENHAPWSMVLLGVCVGLMLLAGAYAAWRAIPEMPVREVSFTGALRHTGKDDLARAVQGVGGNIWDIDLEQLRGAIKRLPWVRDAAVRRVFPARIEVAVEEHQPVAYWGDSRRTGESASLVNGHAEIFQAGFNEPLPHWSGPAGSVEEVQRQAVRFAAILAPGGAKLAEVRLSGRRAWQLRLDNGSVLELGRADTEVRLERFARAQKQVAELQVAGLHADLRYTSGLALRKTAPNLPASKPGNRIGT